MEKQVTKQENNKPPSAFRRKLNKAIVSICMTKYLFNVVIVFILGLVASGILFTIKERVIINPIEAASDQLIKQPQEVSDTSFFYYYFIVMAVVLIIGCLIWAYFYIEKKLRWKLDVIANRYRMQGDAEAHFNLGESYYNGRGVSRDVTQAVIWYQKAAEQDYAKAQLKLGDCLFDGYGIVKDMPQAINWYNKAAEQGIAEAQYNLGTIYEKGNGIEKDGNTALYWYEKAIREGLEEKRLISLAKNCIKELEVAGYSSAKAKIA